jgi:hypothetical protein
MPSESSGQGFALSVTGPPLNSNVTTYKASGISARANLRRLGEADRRDTPRALLMKTEAL